MDFCRAEVTDISVWKSVERRCSSSARLLCSFDRALSRTCMALKITAAISEMTPTTTEMSRVARCLVLWESASLTERPYASDVREGNPGRRSVWCALAADDAGAPHGLRRDLHGRPGGSVRRLVRELEAVTGSRRSTELIYCWDPDGSADLRGFARADHCDHIHWAMDG